MISIRFVTSFLLLLCLSVASLAQRPGPTKPKAGEWFNIVMPIHSRMMMSVSGNEVVLVSTSTDGSQWKFIPMPDKSFRIFNKKNGKFLTVKSSSVLEKLSFTDKPDDYAAWWISNGSGRNERYTFIRNKKSNLFPVKDPDGTETMVQSTGNTDIAAKALTVTLVSLGPID